MASAIHYEILTRGVEQWNAWRSANYMIQPDLSQSGLKGLDLNGANFFGADLSGADLSGADLRRCDLSHSQLRNTKLVGAYLSGANLDRASAEGADLEGVDLTGLSFVQVDFSKANLKKAIIGHDSDPCKIHLCNFTGANLSGAKIRGAEILEGNFTEALFHSADISRTALMLCSFRKAQLWYVTVAESILSSGNFEGAGLLDAKFLRCDFSKHDKLYGFFPPTNFRNSTLRGCHLTGSMFTEASFDGATIRKPISAVLFLSALFLAPPSLRNPQG